MKIFQSNNFLKKKSQMQKTLHLLYIVDNVSRTHEEELKRWSQVNQSRNRSDERQDLRMTLYVQIYQLSPGFLLARCTRYQPCKTALPRQHTVFSWTFHKCFAFNLSIHIYNLHKLTMLLIRPVTAFAYGGPETLRTMTC